MYQCSQITPKLKILMISYNMEIPVYCVAFGFKIKFKDFLLVKLFWYFILLIISTDGVFQIHVFSMGVVLVCWSNYEFTFIKDYYFSYQPHEKRHLFVSRPNTCQEYFDSIKTVLKAWGEFDMAIIVSCFWSLRSPVI